MYEFKLWLAKWMTLMRLQRPLAYYVVILAWCVFCAILIANTQS